MISAWFCSVKPWGDIIAALSAHSWQAAWMGREVLLRTEPYCQTKLYAKCLSLTIVVLTEVQLVNAFGNIEQ